MTKRKVGRPLRTVSRVLRSSTEQPEDPDTYFMQPPSQDPILHPPSEGPRTMSEFLCTRNSRSNGTNVTLSQQPPPRQASQPPGPPSQQARTLSELLQTSQPLLVPTAQPPQQSPLLQPPSRVTSSQSQPPSQQPRTMFDLLRTSQPPP